MTWLLHLLAALFGLQVGITLRSIRNRRPDSLRRVP